MSYEAVQWALCDAPMLLTEAGKPDTTARLVLIARAERADKHGKNTYAGSADMIRMTGFDERTIERAERRLESAGLLVRDGMSHLGTVRWRLDLSLRQAEGNQSAAADRIERRRKADADRKKRQRDREKAPENDQGIDGDGVDKIAVTDSASVTSRILNPDVTDSASGCHGRNAPQTTNEPPGVTTLGTTPGGAPPPDPRRRPPPSASAFESVGSLAIAPTPAQDQQGESLPRETAVASVVEIFPGASQEPPYRSPAPPQRRGALPDVVQEAMERRAAARALHQTRLAEEAKEIS